MTRFFARAGALCAAALLALALAAPAAAQVATVLDQTPVQYGSNQHGEMLTQSVAVPGGKLYVTTLRDAGEAGPVLGIAQTFVSSSSGGLTRYLRLTDAKSDLGVPLTAAAGTPSAAVGVSRTAGTSLQLVGEATSSSAKSDKALFEFNLPDSYVAGANIAVTVNCNYSGSGTVTGASTTMTVAANTESVAGGETALTVSAAQQMAATATGLVYTITGTGLTPGARVTLELTMLVTSASGANTGIINSVAYGA